MLASSGTSYAISKRHSRNEDKIQRAVFQHLKLRGVRDHVAFAVPNGGYRSAKEAAIMKGLGVVPGAPDVIIFHDGQAYALELKAPGGRLSTHQSSMHSQLKAAGITIATVYGIDEALITLEDWGLLYRTAICGRQSK